MKRRVRDGTKGQGGQGSRDGQIADEEGGCFVERYRNSVLALMQPPLECTLINLLRALSKAVWKR